MPLRTQLKLAGSSYPVQVLRSWTCQLTQCSCGHDTVIEFADPASGTVESAHARSLGVQ